MTPLGVLIRVTKQGVGYCSEVNDNVALPGTDTKESNSRIIRVRHVIGITKNNIPSVGDDVVLVARVSAIPLVTQSRSVDPSGYQILHPRCNTIQICPSERRILTPPKSDN
jgi:hypothetical protein